MMKSILAVITGSIAWTIMWLGSNSLIMNIFPQWYGDGGRVESVPVLLFIIARSLVFSIIAGYLTALIAGRHEIKHTIILGILQLAMGVMATVQFYQVAPLWYHLVFLVLLVPGNVLGGQFRMMQHRGRSIASVGGI